MEIIATDIPDVKIIKPDIFVDTRGYFFESYNLEKFEKAGISSKFVQDNESCSQMNVVRGLHFQSPPYAQGKLVRVMSGAVLDVAVDIREGSPWYGKWVSIILNEQNKWMYWIPEGFAHGFKTLENNTVFFYKCTSSYNKESEGSILWNDNDLGIEWDIVNPELSEKDKNAPLFKNFISPFKFAK